MGWINCLPYIPHTQKAREEAMYWKQKYAYKEINIKMIKLLFIVDLNG